MPGVALAMCWQMVEWYEEYSGVIAKEIASDICNHACLLGENNVSQTKTICRKDVGMVKLGTAPYLECSSCGDRRFTAFFARIKARGSRTIEEIYQSSKVFEDGAPGRSWREAKGHRPVNDQKVRLLYATLWTEYMQENPELLNVIVAATGLSDVFGPTDSVCQATELWSIRARALNELSLRRSPNQAPEEEDEHSLMRM